MSLFREKLHKGKERIQNGIGQIAQKGLELGMKVTDAWDAQDRESSSIFADNSPYVRANVSEGMGEGIHARLTFHTNSDRILSKIAESKATTSAFMRGEIVQEGKNPVGSNQTYGVANIDAATRWLRDLSREGIPFPAGEVQRIIDEVKQTGPLNVQTR